VTGVDPAERLLELARADDAARGLGVEFLLGEAGALPIPDRRFDIVVSVFGVVFAPDAAAAVAEMTRVTDTRRRISRHLTPRELDRVREQALELLVRATEQPDEFEVTSRYVIAIAKRAPVP
jgi:ubiquinone/menaquinone biosynthesis C-methylase UbiE